jgi:hypothetical protein
MKIYVFDNDSGLKKRDWAAIVSLPIARIDHDEDGFFIGHENVIWEAGVVLVHQANEMQLEAVRQVINSREDLSAVVISGASQERQPDAPRMYFRKTPVNKPDDASFAAHFREFWNELQKSDGRKPVFSLLEPTAVPALLLAYTLAVQYRLNIPNIQELSTAADTCYDRIQPFAQSLLTKQEKGPISFPEIRVPPRKVFESESPGDPNGLRFKAMRNLIDLLREDL